MKAIGLTRYLPIENPESLMDVELPKPSPNGHDLLVAVKAVGENVTLFKPGDEVFYAGDITRPGSYAEYQLVDERIGGDAGQSVLITGAGGGVGSIGRPRWSSSARRGESCRSTTPISRYLWAA